VCSSDLFIHKINFDEEEIGVLMSNTGDNNLKKKIKNNKKFIDNRIQIFI
jgi:hypothetical protein